MATLIVSYPLARGSFFDRKYYMSTHIPLAQAAWNELGLQSAEILAPAAGLQPLAGMIILRFKDQASIDAALESPATARVISDVANFSNIRPSFFRAND